MTRRQMAAMIAVVTAVTLAVRVLLRLNEGETFAQALSWLTQFFTILTNAVVLIVMTLVSLGRPVNARLMLSAVISIACVGLIYHVLLAHLQPLSGVALLADHGVHTVVPVLTVVWWLVWGQMPPLKWSDPLLWVLWPMAYCGYAMVRAASSGFYPYPFIDLSRLGPSALAVNMVGLVAAFVAVGAIILGLGRLTAAASRRRPQS